MKLYVKIIAFSEQDGVKSTHEECIEVSQKVLRLNEAVMGSQPEDLVNAIATSALIAALQSVQMGGMQSRMEAQQTGPIGGRATVSEDGHTQRPKSTPLESALGLDAGLAMIEAMDQKERSRAPQHGHGGGRGGGGQLPQSPGPIGFGPDRGR